MAGCRSYLRGLAICVTVLLLVSGVVMVGVGFSSSNTPVAELFDKLPTSDGVLALQIFGPITALLSVLGISAATLDLKLLLLLFSLLVLVEFVAVMVVASPLLKIQTQLDGAVDEVFLNATPLHHTELFIQEELNKLQISVRNSLLETLLLLVLFLAVFSSSVGLLLWFKKLPGLAESTSCVLFMPTCSFLWTEPCGPILKNHLSFLIKLHIGIISAFATIAVFAFALCLILGLERFWAEPAVETTVDGFNRVKYRPKPSHT